MLSSLKSNSCHCQHISAHMSGSHSSGNSQSMCSQIQNLRNALIFQLFRCTQVKPVAFTFFFKECNNQIVIVLTVPACIQVSQTSFQKSGLPFPFCTGHFINTSKTAVVVVEKPHTVPLATL